MFDHSYYLPGAIPEYYPSNPFDFNKAILNPFYNPSYLHKVVVAVDIDAYLGKISQIGWIREYIFNHDWLPVVGPSTYVTQIELGSVPFDFSPPVSAKQAVIIGNQLMKDKLGRKQPEKIKIELANESPTSIRKIWAISYWGCNVPDAHLTLPMRSRKEGDPIPIPAPFSPNSVQQVIAIGIDPDTGKSHGIYIAPKASWKSWMPPPQT